MFIISSKQGSNFPPLGRDDSQSGLLGRTSGLLGKGGGGMRDVEALNWLVHYEPLVYITKHNLFR